MVNVVCDSIFPWTVIWMIGGTLVMVYYVDDSDDDYDGRM